MTIQHGLMLYEDNDTRVEIVENPRLPGVFDLRVDGLEDTVFVPLTPDVARSLADKLTRWADYRDDERLHELGG